MDAETLAYAAGLLDSEGSLCIVSAIRKQHLPTYYLVVNIANTHRATIEWLQETFACGYLNQPKPTSVWHRPIYLWHVQSNPAAQFLRMIYPYLVVKREQATVALAFCDYHQGTLHRGSEETTRRKEVYRQQIKDLNSRARESGPSMPAVLSAADLAFLAGFFDGEGSVKVLVRESRMRKRGKGLPLYGLRADIGNSDYPILQWYQSVFSGGIAPMRSASAVKPMWRWRIYGDTAQDFLRAVLPYLKIKREQALLGIEFQDYHRAHWQAVHAVCTTEVLARKEEYRQRISQLALYARTIKPIPAPRRAAEYSPLQPVNPTC